MTARNANRVANAILLTAGGVLAVLAWRRPAVRRAVFRAAPMMLGGTPPLRVAALVVARAIADRHQGDRTERPVLRQPARLPAATAGPEPPIPGVPV
jgi:hypothetical protein